MKRLSKILIGLILLALVGTVEVTRIYSLQLVAYLFDFSLSWVRGFSLSLLIRVLVKRPIYESENTLGFLLDDIVTNVIVILFLKLLIVFA